LSWLKNSTVDRVLFLKKITKDFKSICFIVPRLDQGKNYFVSQGSITIYLFKSFAHFKNMCKLLKKIKTWFNWKKIIFLNS